ncbi:hypothetical protein BBJ29_004711 [Phytophthora kernoviae]|uniref:Uncharacterized protein n=1 Tax=Phytophthora kernoviae TaxID=325452 RepID=A0A3F2RIU6_9STRA|nr:hypothetical protein BBJ29_004711 [Phytophthora kernoviae]RLN58088.1 hypothetical protein BBP00_00007189 [Phytophthora kernoviae]
MSELGDVAAMFSSKQSARILLQHRNSMGSMNTGSEEVQSPPDIEGDTDASSVHKVKQQLAELENSPAPTKAEIDELLAQYSDYSDGSESSGSGQSGNSSSSSSDDQEMVIMKVLIVGNARCGKTSTIRRFTQDNFNEEYVSTIGADFVEKVIEYDEQLTISLQLWDIAGQDRFAKFTRGYFREAKGAVIVCDITRANTIEAVENWKNEIDMCCKDLNDGTEIPVVMVANKSDLLVNPMDALDLGVNMQKCVAKNNIVEWFRASAKSGEKVPDAFQCLVDRMVKDYRTEKDKSHTTVTEEEEQEETHLIRLSQPPQKYKVVKQEGFGCDCN